MQSFSALLVCTYLLLFLAQPLPINRREMVLTGLRPHFVNTSFSMCANMNLTQSICYFYFVLTTDHDDKCNNECNVNRSWHLSCSTVSVVVKYCADVSSDRQDWQSSLLILIKPKPLCSILRIVLPLLRASIGVTRSYSKWMMFQWHILSGCQMCNWCFQYQLCSTHRELWGL